MFFSPTQEFILNTLSIYIIYKMVFSIIKNSIKMIILFSEFISFLEQRKMYSKVHEYAYNFTAWLSFLLMCFEFEIFFNLPLFIGAWIAILGTQFFAEDLYNGEPVAWICLAFCLYILFRYYIHIYI